MASYIDQVMALFPFEPEAMKKLGGPPTTYVGHPLLDQIATLRPDAAERAQRDTAPMLVVLPGSRRGELRRLMPLFGATLKPILDRHPGLEVVLPTLPHLRDMVAALAAEWPVVPRIVVGMEERQAAFRRARAALVKSGTVTLELALSGVPMAVAYRIAWSETLVAGLLLRVKTVVLANLVIGQTVVPEFIQHRATPGRLAAAVSDILDDGPSRQQQIEAFARLDAIMETGGRTPRQRAADVAEAALKSPQ
jgi:lipid-A-disaccharide synthase